MDYVFLEHGGFILVVVGWVDVGRGVLLAPKKYGVGGWGVKKRTP